MYIHVCVHLRVCVGNVQGDFRVTGVLLSLCLIPRSSLLLKPASPSHVLPLSSYLLLSAGVTDSQVTPAFYMGAENLNSGLHMCIKSAKPLSISPA